MSTERHTTDRRPWRRPTTVAGPLLVLASIVTSLFAARTLDSSVRIRWSAGTYYGPEYAPTDPVMLAFPAAVAGTVVAISWVAPRVVGDDRPDARLVVDCIGAGVGGLLVTTQLLVVVLNL